MKENIQISEAELEVMKLLWKNKKMTSTKIVDNLLKTSDWKDKTILTLINRLVKKGAVNAEKENGKAFLYSANINEEEYKLEQSNSLINRLFNGSISLMMSNFVKSNNISNEDIEELKRILESRE